jgi:hypothetical protein
MMFGFGKKKNDELGPFAKFVMDRAGDDEFLRENREGGTEYASILYIALTIGLKEAGKLKKEKQTKKLFSNTLLDLLACEYALFSIQQARWILANEKVDEDYDDYDDFEDNEVDDKDLSYLLGSAFQLFKALGEKFYDDFDAWWADRVKSYTKDPKQASESFAFNLVALEGKEDFVGLDKAVNLNLEGQLTMIAHSVAYRQTMVPAFIESSNTLLALDMG